MAELRQRDDKKEAYHEAGHIVAAVVLGRNLGVVSLADNWNDLAHTPYKPWLTVNPADLCEDTERAGVVAVAGWFVERMEFGDQADADAASNDLSEATRIAIDGGSVSTDPARVNAEIHAWLEGVKLRAEKILRGNLAAVRAIPRALLKHGALSEEELRDIVRCAH